MRNRYLVTTILALRLLLFPLDVIAAPELAEIVQGSADFVHDGTTLTITVHTDVFIANYHSFNIGAIEVVRFIQPSATSTALNRVIGIGFMVFSRP